jgi:hypothetical protein
MTKPKGQPYQPGKAMKEIRDKAKEVQKAIRESLKPKKAK